MNISKTIEVRSHLGDAIKISDLELELSEALKTIDSLKTLIQKNKQEQAFSLSSQKRSYEGTSLNRFILTNEIRLRKRIIRL